MVSISPVGTPSPRIETNASSTASSGVNLTSTDTSSGIGASATAGTTSDRISISTIAGRLSKAATATSDSTQGLGHDALSSKVQKNIETVLYPFDTAHRAAAAKQVPDPADAASVKSAASATAFLDGRAENPFAGFSREQLITITNDESGTFTVNERRAAYTQAYNEEEAWREQLAAKGMSEYNSTGKMTNFFKEALSHFNELPELEQSLYPANYASDLQAKVKLDFNYFNHSAGDAGPTPGSLAMLNKSGKLSNLFDLMKFPVLHPKASVFDDGKTALTS